jgi:heparosan-N-sulfate-glucuronate 5-epimerase
VTAGSAAHSEFQTRTRAERFLGRSFRLPPGPRSEPERVHGYPIDFSERAVRPEPWEFEPGRELWVPFVQWALGCHERWLATGDERWLAGARRAGDVLVAEQERDGAATGAWLHRFDYPHTFDVRSPWASGMAQGEGASLLVRLCSATSDGRYADAATRALEPLLRCDGSGRAAAELGGALVPEEYPTEPPSHVLNGLIFGLWGMRDLAVGLGHDRAARAFPEAVDALAGSIDRWDTGSWSLYDLYPHRVANWASPAYHELHVTQLQGLEALAPRPELARATIRFARYSSSRAARARAFVRKALFRALVPRRALRD